METRRLGAMSTKEEAEGQDGLPQGSWALSRLPSTDLVLVSYCCPRAWFVQKPREAATISRWVLQGKGSEWGDLLFSCEQNLLAEFFLKEGPRSVCVMLVVISQGWLQASSHSGALSDGYLGWQFSTRGRTAPPPVDFWQCPGTCLIVTVGRECYGLWWAEARDAAKHSTMHMAAPTMSYPRQSVHSGSSVGRH